MQTLTDSQLDTYLPFFFQDYQGVSTTISGARFFILVGPQVISLVLTAAQLVPRGIKLVSLNPTHVRSGC